MIGMLGGLSKDLAELEPTQRPVDLAADWEVDGECAGWGRDGTVVLHKVLDDQPGSERGLAGKSSYSDVTLEFQLLLRPDSHFVAKIHLVNSHDQLTNSYHLVCKGPQAYLARHNHILRELKIPVGRWVQMAFSYREGRVELHLDRVEIARVADGTLESGNCFLGIKGGEAQLRQIHLRASAKAERTIAGCEVLRRRSGAHRPAVSIITPVYDRVDCLARCLRSVKALRFEDYEQIVVVDGPPRNVLERIATLVADSDGVEQRVTLAVLKSRHNDWGITPAAAGLSLAEGKYVCFLSDDNGYLPTHFDRLVSTLESEPDLGFAYSSCLYGRRRLLDAPVPRPGQIDLGQPLFRRELFDLHLAGALPFHEFGWDWRMIERFLQKGVCWKHLNDYTFIFGLAKYPDLIAPIVAGQSGPVSEPAPEPPAVVVEGPGVGESIATAKAEYAALECIGRTQPRELPRQLAEYRGYHQGETILVCGCGVSLSQVVAPERFTTIGVNDVGRLLNPDYLLVINPRTQFSGDRFRYVETSQAKALFTQLDLGIPHPHIVRFRLGKRAGADLSDDNSLPYTRNSPYVAFCLALHMGARRIGLIGVDFTDHHFFAATGRHPLAGDLAQINNEYTALAKTCRTMGVEVYNLSEASRLTAFPKMSPADFARTSLTPPDAVSALSGSKVFFVNYRFLSCGEVFSDGLRNAAQDLGVQSESAYWDDSNLPAKVEKFAPDLLFVVHGRKYSQRWKSSLHKMPSAVWLLDEPYEVDDTSRFSRIFGTVFVNDSSTLHRHNNAHFLPVCFDPGVYYYRPGDRQHRLGFIGGGNPARELILKELAGRGLLSYAVGGPWRDPQITRFSLSGNIPAAQTADLYRQTQIVANVFRTAHHYNREQIPAVSMNPRVYEALACGALVVSERRAEIERLCPEMPVFESREEMVSIVEGLLGNPARLDSVRKACIRRLAGHTYAHRLHTVLAATLGKCAERPWEASSMVGIPAAQAGSLSPPPIPAPAVAIFPDWEADSKCLGTEDGVIVLRNDDPPSPGSETGLIGAEAYGDIRLSFEVLVEPGAIFIAKIHLREQRNQKSNSYHLTIDGTNSYVARHDKVLGSLSMRSGAWKSVAMTFCRGTLFVECGLDGELKEVACHIQDNFLPSGYCFLGVKSGTARVREPAMTVSKPDELPVKLVDRGIAILTPPQQQAGTIPFTTTPRRNLIYHVWPVRGSMWRWNMEQLKARLDLFNGRRLIGIVHDSRSEDPSAVQAFLEGHGCEFLVAPNHPAGEVVTFPQMLRRVASTDANEVTFYGHAKGVKHEPAVPQPVRRWAEISYSAALDNWLTVRAQLERFALTGSFRMFGRFGSHRNVGDWHYSGTYFWLRHARVFAKDCFAVPPFYCGVEAWPGKYFARDEAGCLLFDNLRQLAYDESFWPSREDEILRWQAERSAIEPPPDLEQPAVFDSCEWPRLEQRPDEFEWFLERLAETAPRNMLTIGGMHGGVEWHLARRFRSLAKDIEITVVEIAPTPELLASIEDARTRFGQRINFVEGDSTEAAVRARLSSQYDGVFIDGDHSYRNCRSDFEFALSLSPRIIAIHDIVDSDWHAQARCSVSKLWAELRERYPSEQRTTGDWGGIGIIRRLR